MLPQVYPGLGIAAWLPVDGHASGPGICSAQGSSGDIRIAIGNRQLMRQEGVHVPAGVDEDMESREQDGCTCVVLAMRQEAAAVFAVQDPLKPEAPAVVAALRDKGIECHLLTGEAAEVLQLTMKGPACSHVRYSNCRLVPFGSAGACCPMQVGPTSCRFPI